MNEDGSLAPEKIITGCVIFLVACFLFAWLIEGNNFFLMKYFAPKYANVQRQVFQQSDSYQQGLTQRVRDEEKEYKDAVRSSDTEHAKGIASMIVHETSSAANFDPLPEDLKSFVTQLRNQ